MIKGYRPTTSTRDILSHETLKKECKGNVKSKVCLFNSLFFQKIEPPKSNTRLPPLSANKAMPSRNVTFADLDETMTIDSLEECGGDSRWIESSNNAVEVITTYREICNLLKRNHIDSTSFRELDHLDCYIRFRHLVAQSIMPLEKVNGWLKQGIDFDGNPYW